MDGDFSGDNFGAVNTEALQSYVRRAVNLVDERETINEDLKEVYAEAKDAGFDTGVLRQVVREWRTDSEARNVRYALIEAYRQGLGLYADTPLGQATIEREARQPRRRRKTKAQPLDEVEAAGQA